MHWLVGPIVGGVGVVVLIITVVLGWVIVPNIIDDKIIEEVRLVPGTDTWEKWEAIPVPIFLKFHTYSITNPDEVERGARPKFDEKGPYSYREERKKVNVSLVDGGDVVKYEQTITYFFQQNASCEKCFEDDKINIINVAFLSVIMVVHDEVSPWLAAFIANGALGTETFVRRDVRVGDLTFEGFDTRLYSETLGPLLPEEFSGGRFGLYKGTNGSADGVYEIYTGVGKTADFGRVKTYEGYENLDELGWWQNGTFCSAINGTDGSVFPPFVEKSWVMYVFSTDLCRSLYLTFEKEVEHRGIKGYRFVAPKKMLENPRTNHDNQCFCMEEHLEDCPHSGVIHIKGCKGGAPIMMSTPHFLDGDVRYLNASQLPPPVKEEHETVIDVEPNSGLTLRANKRIQVNVEVIPIGGIDALEHIKEYMVFPLIWADEEAILDEDNADDLKGRLLTPLKIVNIGKWTVLGVSVAVIALGAVIFFIHRRNAKQNV